MSWKITATRRRTVTVAHDAEDAFSRAIGESLEDPWDYLSLLVEGPRSATLDRALDDLSATTPARINRAAPPDPHPRGHEPHGHHPATAPDLNHIVRAASLAQAYGGLRDRELHELLARHAERYPSPAEARRVDAALREGRAQGALRCDIHDAIKRHGVDAAPVEDLLRRAIRRYPRARSSFQSIVDRARRASGHAILGPTTHDHRVWTLPPSDVWHLFIDETGAHFDATPTGGAIWGVLVPDATLSQIPRPADTFHAVEETGDAIDRVVADLLEHRVGLVGVEATGFAPISDPARRWLAGITDLLDWVLRLLPLAQDGRRTTLNVVVEQRGPHADGEVWAALPTALLAQLSRYHPERADAIDLPPIHVSRKHACGAWVDTIAHAWGGSGREARARRALLELDRFVVGASGLELRRLFDHGLGRGSLSVPTWRTCLSLKANARTQHVVHALLERLAERVRETPEQWEQLLDATIAALHQGQLVLDQIGLEVDWLERARPDGAALRPVARLAWALARLAMNNRHGQLGDDATVADVGALSARLVPEAPQISALADLHLAVTHTNRFDFARAAATLAPWLDRPEGVGGRAIHARVRSSLGQHAAFRSDFASADGHFNAALEAFSALSDPREAAPELARTRLYRAIAAMDDPACADLVALDRLLEAIDAPARALSDPATAAFVTELAATTTTSGPSPWRAHAILRLASSGRPIASTLRDLITPAIALVAPPAAPQGFPWPLIWMHRALTLRRAMADEATIGQAARHARALLGRGEGPTLALIEWTIEAALLPPGGRTSHRDATEALDDLKLALPRLARPISQLNAWLQRAGDDPELLLRTILPFNFR
jgi:hypothetical protein